MNHKMYTKQWNKENIENILHSWFLINIWKMGKNYLPQLKTKNNIYLINKIW